MTARGLSKVRTLLVALVAVASACAMIHPRSPKPRPDDGDWAEIRDAATRAKQLYDGVDHRANAIAVHLTPKVREARASRLGDWYAWTPAELDARLAQERAEAAAGEEFVLALYTADFKANDLDAPQPSWRIALVVDGINVLATKVEAIPLDWQVRQLYPLFGPFDTIYRVRFPPAPDGGLGTRAFVLRLTSGMGAIDLDFGGPAIVPSGLDAVPPAAR